MQVYTLCNEMLPTRSVWKFLSFQLLEKILLEKYNESFVVGIQIVVFCSKLMTSTPPMRRRGNSEDEGSSYPTTDLPQQRRYKYFTEEVDGPI